MQGTTLTGSTPEPKIFPLSQLQPFSQDISIHWNIAEKPFVANVVEHPLMSPSSTHLADTALLKFLYTYAIASAVRLQGESRSCFGQHRFPKLVRELAAISLAQPYQA